MKSSQHLLVRVLREPELLAKLSLADWDILVPQARTSYLLGRLSVLVEGKNLTQTVQENVLNHLTSVQLISSKQANIVRWEIDRIHDALKKVDLSFVLLKGAAYLAVNSPNSDGRILSDIDIMVPKSELAQAEAVLSLHSWVSPSGDEYDDKYYREWMHEIPPLKHLKRHTVLDLHHTILPPTAKLKPQAKKLFANARDTATKGVRVLAPEDMVIHSATHLFHEGEFTHGLRDLVDLDCLMWHFAATEKEFWTRLVPRAQELDLLRPLYYGLHYCQLMLHSTIPDDVMQAVSVARPKGLMSYIMDKLFLLALLPDHPSCDRPLTPLARFLLFVRSHYLRMPMHLLIPHLLRKAWKRRFDKQDQELPGFEQIKGEMAGE